MIKNAYREKHAEAAKVGASDLRAEAVWQVKLPQGAVTYYADKSRRVFGYEVTEKIAYRLRPEADLLPELKQSAQWTLIPKKTRNPLVDYVSYADGTIGVVVNTASLGIIALDTEWVFFPDTGKSGYWSEWLMREIAMKLAELNAGIRKGEAEYFGEGLPPFIMDARAKVEHYIDLPDVSCSISIRGFDGLRMNFLFIPPAGDEIKTWNIESQSYESSGKPERNWITHVDSPKHK